MFIQVRLLKGFTRPLWYRVPDAWSIEALAGSFVQVPVRAQIVPAVVQKIQSDLQVDFAVKYAHAREPFPQDRYYTTFIHALSDYYALEPHHFLTRMNQFFTHRNPKKPSDRERVVSETALGDDVVLTPEQETICKTLGSALDQRVYYPAVLHGVTGSGKTEVYQNLILRAIRQGTSVILLLPEVSLAVQFAQRLGRRFGDTVTIVGLHSATSRPERRKVWQRLIASQPMLLIGVHLPVLLPIPNLGLIIVDEEHESGFQEKKHPKINSKEAALFKARIYGVPIVLGSATPSVVSWYNVQHKGWRLFELKNRFRGEFPKITMVRMNRETPRKQFWVSRALFTALEAGLQRNQQAIIFINRRGWAFFVQCKQCNFIFYCNHCSVSLTVHQDMRLRCHYCRFTIAYPEVCTDCGVGNKNFLKKGIGTQQVVQLLQQLIPQARIARADMDTTVNKKNWNATLQAFSHGSIDILVGTQTITKGYDFKNVSLVGVLWADLNLHVPLYNAAERALQQLIQVAGRAGRYASGAEVILQTSSDHPIFTYVNEIDYPKFIAYELEKRLLVKYPPMIRLYEIELKAVDEPLLADEAEKLVGYLQAAIHKTSITATVLGPVKPPLAKVLNMHAMHMFIKAEHHYEVVRLYQSINHNDYQSQIFFTPHFF